MPRDETIIHYLRLHREKHGVTPTGDAFGVSRDAVWRALNRGRLGRKLPRAINAATGGTLEGLEEAIRQLTEPDIKDLPKDIEDTFREVCASPFATTAELAALRRVPPTTLRRRLRVLADRGFVASVHHAVPSLSLRPYRRLFPTADGLEALQSWFPTALHIWPVSRQWFRLLLNRLDSLAVLYALAKIVADSDRHSRRVQVDVYRQGPYDALLTIEDGPSIGIMRLGPAVDLEAIRHRIQAIGVSRRQEWPRCTLIVAHSVQVLRQVIRHTGYSLPHAWTWAGLEASVLAGELCDRLWQQCGQGRGPHGVSDKRVLAEWPTKEIIRAMDDLKLAGGRPEPGILYSRDVEADFPAPEAQVAAAPTVQLKVAAKRVIDLVAAWPLATTEQIAGLLGGISTERASQILITLVRRGMVCRLDGRRHVLDLRGLRYIAGRDRASVGGIFRAWRPETEDGKSRGSSLRGMLHEHMHQAGLVELAAMLTVELASSDEVDLVDLVPTRQAAITIRYAGARYSLFPDAAFVLVHKGRRRHVLLEYERSAKFPQSARERLYRYGRYYGTEWVMRDHEGRRPALLFVCETEAGENVMRRAADAGSLYARQGRVNAPPILTSTIDVLRSVGFLGTAWRVTENSDQPLRRASLFEIVVGGEYLLP